MNMTSTVNCESKEIKRLSTAIVNILKYAKQNTTSLQYKINEFILREEVKEKVVSETPQKPEASINNIISQMSNNLTEISEILDRQREIIDNVLTDELRRL